MHSFVGVSRMTVHESLQGHELGELAAEDLGIAPQVVHHALRRLLILREVTTLEKAIRVWRRVHKEVRRSVQLDYDATQLVWVAVVVLEVNGFDGCEGILNFVTSLFIVDVVGHGTFVRRVENDEVHGVLAHTRPLADTERAAGQVVNHFDTLLANFDSLVTG